MLTALLISLLIGCKPVQVVGGSTVKAAETVSASRQTDTVVIYERDSVYVREKGDTVYVAHWRTRYRDRWRERTDTLVVRDSIAIETPVVVAKPLSGWQNFQVWCGRLLLGLLAAWGVSRLIKRYFKPF